MASMLRHYLELRTRTVSIPIRGDCADVTLEPCGLPGSHRSRPEQCLSAAKSVSRWGCPAINHRLFQMQSTGDAKCILRHLGGNTQPDVFIFKQQKQTRLSAGDAGNANNRNAFIVFINRTQFEVEYNKLTERLYLEVDVSRTKHN